jgi:hypothetical protein
MMRQQAQREGSVNGMRSPIMSELFKMEQCVTNGKVFRFEKINNTMKINFYQCWKNFETLSHLKILLY